MMFSNDVLIRVMIFALGLCGFLVARHIYKHKSNTEDPLVCPINFDCHAVVHSDYSKFLKMPVDFLGIIYYAFISLAYFFLIFVPNVIPITLVVFLNTLSLVAFLFSIYLISIQIFVLKKGCSWCIVSSIISALILILTLFNHNSNFIMQIFSN